MIPHNMFSSSWSQCNSSDGECSAVGITLFSVAIHECWVKLWSLHRVRASLTTVVLSQMQSPYMKRLCTACYRWYTLRNKYIYIYFFFDSPPTHFSHLDGRSFSRRLSFHLSSQQLSLLPFSLIMYEKKSSRVLPAHVLLPMHLPVIFHTAVKVQIPLAICNQKCHICNLAELGTLGRIVWISQLSVLLQSPKHLRQTGSNCISVCHPSWTCSPKPPQLVFRPLPINQFITQTHHTVNEMNHFTLWSRTIYACQLFDTGRLNKKNEPASGVAAGASGACKFCTSKITIKSHLYPPGIVYIYIYLYYLFIHPTHFSHLGGRSFSRRLSFHLSSQQLSLLSFSLIMFEKKFPGAPCTCCVANASSSYIPHCGESTDTFCNQKYLQSGWSKNFGSDSFRFPAVGFATSPKTSTTNRFELHPCLHPSWTCSREPPLLVFRPSPINRLIFLHKHTHYTVNGRNHFTLWSRTIYACRFFDSCRLPKKYEPASGVAAGASGACRFCTSKITIKSDVYPRRIILYHIISYHIISYHIMSCHIISYHIILYYIWLYYIVLYIYIYLSTLHSSATSAAGVSAGVSAFTYRHKKKKTRYCE